MIDRDQLTTLIKANLEALESVRLQQNKQFAALRKKYFFIVVGTVALLWLVGKFFEQEGTNLSWTLVILSSTIVIFIALTSYFKKTSPFIKTLEERVKKEVYKKAIAQWHPQLTYYPQKHLPETLYKEATLFGYYNIYQGDDYLEGTLPNGQNLAFSELKVQSESSDPQDNNSSTTTVFKGLFFVLDLPMAINASIKILPDAAERGLGKLGLFLQKKFGKLGHAGELVYFEDYPDFEKEFVVYSSQEEIARKLLTPSIMQLLQAMNAKTKGIALSILGNRLYLAASTRKEFLEVNIQESLIRDALVDQLIEDLDYSLALINDLQELSTNGIQNIQQSSSSNPPKSGLSYKKSSSKDNPFLL